MDVDQVVNMLVQRGLQRITEAMKDQYKGAGKPEVTSIQHHPVNQPPKEIKLADQIRQQVLQTQIEPARRNARTEITLRTGDVHKALGLRNRLPRQARVKN